MNSSAEDDVVGITQNAPFQPNQTSGSCIFRIAQDTTPEGNETFSVELMVIQGTGSVVSPSVAYLTILANDDAFGIIGFNEVSMSITFDVPVMGKICKSPWLSTSQPHKFHSRVQLDL